MTMTKTKTSEREPMVFEIEYRDTDGFMQTSRVYPREALTLVQALAARLDEWAKEGGDDADRG